MNIDENGLTECHCLWKYVIIGGPSATPQSWRSNGQARIFHSTKDYGVLGVRKEVCAVIEVLGQEVPGKNFGRNLMIGRKQQHRYTAPQGRGREKGQGRGWLIVRRYLGETRVRMFLRKTPLKVYSNLKVAP